MIEIGPSSGRSFDLDCAGGPIHRLSAERIRFTRRGVTIVEKHLGRFNAPGMPPDRANQVMIARLWEIAEGRKQAETVDRNFYAHELREYVRYRRLGYERGQPTDPDAARELWNNAHTAALEDYGLREGPGILYHPDADLD